MLQWVAIPFFRDLLDPGIEPGSTALQADSLSAELYLRFFTREVLETLEWVAQPFSSGSSGPRN